MKIVHSFWSKPALANSGSLEKMNGGWRHPKYHLMSWALSCLSFKKHYGEIELVTDAAGKHLLIDQLKLPYTSVRVELDSLNKYPKKLWAIGKLYAYSIQEKPFIHVDGDTYIWSRFNSRIEKANLIGQHVDVKPQHYTQALDQLIKLNFELPKFLLDDYEKTKEFNASNAGIIGGNNLEFFKKYTHEAFRFIDKNLLKIDASLRGDSYALIYEQYLYSALARHENHRIDHILNESIASTTDLTDFMNKFGTLKYVHLISNMKYCLEYCLRLEHILLLEYPEYYRKITLFTNTDYEESTHSF